MDCLLESHTSEKGTEKSPSKTVQLYSREWLEFDRYQSRLNCQGYIKMGD